MNRKTWALAIGAILLIGVVVARESEAQTGIPSEGQADALAGGATLSAELETALDSKKVKVDEKIEIKTTEALKIQGKVIFPKGTKIVGRVTQSTARARGDAESMLAVQFEKAVLKGGEEVPVRLAIKAIAPARQAFSAGDSPGQDPMSGTRAGTTASPMGSSRTAPTGPERGGGYPAGSSGADGGLGDQGQLTAESRGVYGMSGMRLAVDVSKTKPVSVVSSTNKNVKLDSGTRLLLVSIADVPTNSPR